MLRLDIREGFFFPENSPSVGQSDQRCFAIPKLEAFKIQLDKALSNLRSDLRSGPTVSQRLDWRAHELPSDPRYPSNVTARHKNCKRGLIVQDTSVRMNRLILTLFSLRSF